MVGKVTKPIHVSEELQEQFKSWCASRGLKMKEVVEQMIKEKMEVQNNECI